MSSKNKHDTIFHRFKFSFLSLYWLYFSFFYQNKSIFTYCCSVRIVFFTKRFTFEFIQNELINTILSYYGKIFSSFSTNLNVCLSKNISNGYSSCLTWNVVFLSLWRCYYDKLFTLPSNFTIISWFFSVIFKWWRFEFHVYRYLKFSSLSSPTPLFYFSFRFHNFSFSLSLRWPVWSKSFPLKWRIFFRYKELQYHVEKNTTE